LKKPELTIGVSFYNTADTLVDLAKYIFAQTFTNWEWILIDDGSTDGGYDIVRVIKDPRVRVIRDEANRGRSFRYNYITDIARNHSVDLHTEALLNIFSEVISKKKEFC
jgi:glycosyltransferase involved in cell wall biosynthesis